jgi:ascorbate-specific PTS system EIIC-type component UlaA
MIDKTALDLIIPLIVSVFFSGACIGLVITIFKKDDYYG